MEQNEGLTFVGCNFFRQRITFSVLSGRPITISRIREDHDSPGIAEKCTNGTKVIINKTGTQIDFTPGMITGGSLTMNCGTARCLSYFLEPLILISPFCKQAMRIKLVGVTNCPNELSVDAIKTGWLNVYNRFVLNDEDLGIKIERRGLKPDGGGVVFFFAPVVRTLRPVVNENAGKVCKIRGQAYVTKVSPSMAHRMIESAKTALANYISDVYITVDQRKGDAGGFGLFLSAETTEGVFYVAEAISEPKGSESDTNLTAEEIGEVAGFRLLDEIYRGGCCDSSAQLLTALFMTLGDKDVSKYLMGPLSCNTIHALKHMQQFFQMTFKIDDFASSDAGRKVLEKDSAIGDHHKEDLETLVSSIILISEKKFGRPNNRIVEVVMDAWQYLCREGASSLDIICLEITTAEWLWLAEVTAAKKLEGISVIEASARAFCASVNRSEQYNISIYFNANFPLEEPVLECSYQAGFRFSWRTSGHCLVLVLQDYVSFVDRLDAVVLMIRACEDFYIKIIKMAAPLVSISTKTQEEPASSVDIHCLPCKISYTGPAIVADEHEATFRGRDLLGKQVKIPDNLELGVLVSAKNVESFAAHFTDWSYGVPNQQLLASECTGIFVKYRDKVKCSLFECCDVPYINPNFRVLRDTLNARVYGQHIVLENVVDAIQTHWNGNSEKPLVMTFHGYTGSGKNFVSTMIAENIYRNGMNSNFVHLIMAAADYPDASNIVQYELELAEKLKFATQSCGRSLFIFDEVDKMPERLLSYLKSFLDHHHAVAGVDYRKSIFIFLSNKGSEEILRITVAHHEAGRARTTLKLNDFEGRVAQESFNKDGGLKKSELISSQLIDHYLPFLPLERSHVEQCVKAHFERSALPELARQLHQVKAVADELQYFPSSNPIFSSSGCKRVSAKADLIIARLRKKAPSSKATTNDEL